MSVEPKQNLVDSSEEISAGLSNKNYIKRAKRLPLQVQVFLELKDGAGFTGRTELIGISENISDSGLIFKPDFISPSDLTIGTLGILHLMPIQKGFCQPCQVARITNDCIAVRFSRLWPDFETVVGELLELG